MCLRMYLKIAKKNRFWDEGKINLRVKFRLMAKRKHLDSRFPKLLLPSTGITSERRRKPATLRWRKKGERGWGRWKRREGRHHGGSRGDVAGGEEQRRGEEHGGVEVEEADVEEEGDGGVEEGGASGGGRSGHRRVCHGRRFLHCW